MTEKDLIREGIKASFIKRKRIPLDEFVDADSTDVKEILYEWCFYDEDVNHLKINYHIVSGDGNYIEILVWVGD